MNEEDKRAIINDIVRLQNGKAHGNGRDESEILRLAKLSSIKYGHEREASAERLGVRVSVLDSIVNAERSKAKEQTDFLPHWKNEQLPKTVDGAALLEELRKHFARYIVLPKHADIALALWTLHTWVFDCFRHYALSGNHVADAALRQDCADDHALLAVLPSQEKRPHEQGVDLSKR